MRKANALYLFAALLFVVSGCGDNKIMPNPIMLAGTGAPEPAAGTGPAPVAGQTGQTTGSAGTSAATGAAGTTGAAAAAGRAGSTAAGSGGASGTTAAGSGGMPSVATAGMGGSTEPTGSGDPEFDMCYAQVKDHCVASELNTAVLIEAACKEVQNIPLPLTGGGMYGPITIKAGPYGGKTDWNEGAGTEFVNTVNTAEPICVPVGIETFMEPASTNAELENLRDIDWSLYTIFRPACFKKGEKYPVITWANGTCGETHGYSVLLTSLASHGFVIIASNSTWTNTAPTDKVQLRALDYAKALNEDPKSIFYQKLDMDHIGAMGHSQGAAATASADNDPRIKSVIFWNKATSDVKPFLNISGDRDVNPTTPAAIASGVNAESQPGGWVYFHKVPETGGTSTGHLTLMEQPERVLDLTVAWWKWQLKADEEAKKMFVGDACGLCKTPDEFEYGHNTLLK